MSDDISIKGLDEFSSRFLISGSPEGEDEYIRISGGQKLSDDALKNYATERATEFISRAGHFTEDLVAFVVEQKKMRSLSDTETVFAIALANINLRSAYGRQANENTTSDEEAVKLEEFDGICWGAQQYWDANKE